MGLQDHTADSIKLEPTHEMYLNMPILSINVNTSTLEPTHEMYLNNKRTFTGGKQYDT